MAKSLGQIHTVNYTLGLNNTPIGLVEGDAFLIDLPGQLTSQLQRMCRVGCYYKLVGVDMSLSTITGAAVLEPIPVSGVMKYYAPTEGRCEALKSAWMAVKNAMKVQGIEYHTNKQYDFRPIISIPATFVNGADFFNTATFDGTNYLTLDSTGTHTTDRIFDVYNENINPQTAFGGAQFSSGFGLPGSIATATDFVLNEGRLYNAGDPPLASTAMEEIPFQLDYGIDTTTNTSAAITLQWRPDPALYMAILTGQIIVELTDIATGTLNDYVIEAAFHVSGWKSVMGSKHKKHRRARSSKKAGKKHGRRRRSRK